MELEDPAGIHALAIGSRVSGTATMTITALEEAGDNERILSSDRSRFAADVRAGAPVFAEVSFAASVGTTMYGVPDGLSLRQGAWTVFTPATATSPARQFRHFADRGQPTSRTEYSKNGVVQFITTTVWARVTGGWAVRERTTTLFSEGRAVRRIKQSFSQLEAAPGGADSRSTPSSALRKNETIEQPNSADCTGYLESLDDALAYYLASDLALVACLGGPLSCIVAGINLTYAAYNFDVANARANGCLNAQ